MARIMITGATGTLGRALAVALRGRGDEVVALSRDVERARARLGEDVTVHAWPEPKDGPPPEAALAEADGVVNLLGEPIAQRWSAATKRELRDSRVLGTRSLVSGLRALPETVRPRVLVSQSATGFYGSRDGRPLDEEAPAGSDFLAELVVAWEREAHAATPATRVAVSRTGVVLSPRAGALAKMLPPFRLGLGGPVAGGRQYVSWVHIDDVVGALLRCLDDAAIEGPVNVTTPNPVPNAELARALGRVLRRPAVLPVPAVALRLLYGEMAQTVTGGQRVLPVRLQHAGYEFRHPEIEPALRDVLGRS